MSKYVRKTGPRQQPEPIGTDELCSYGCNQVARWKFSVGRLCCSKSVNSCPEKRRVFSEEINHKEYSARSLDTRLRMGITKSSQVKATITRIANGHYEKMAAGNRKRMLENPYTNNTRCPLLQYKDSGVIYQGGYERYFLENFENRLGLEWIRNNIKRGPGIWYDWQDRPHLYLPDYLIGNTIYEIKSSYTWNRLGKDLQLQERNISKLKATVLSGYSVILVLDHKEMEFI